MTSPADILRHISRERLDAFARAHAPQPALATTDEQLVEALAKQAGHKILDLLAELGPEELQVVADATGHDPGDLVMLVAPPATRGDCEKGLRPCPYRTCRHNVHDGPEPVCALDVADEGGVIQDTIAEILGVTRQRVQQIEKQALERIQGRAKLFRLTDLIRRDKTPESGAKPSASRRTFVLEDPNVPREG